MILPIQARSAQTFRLLYSILLAALLLACLALWVPAIVIAAQGNTQEKTLGETQEKNPLSAAEQISYQPDGNSPAGNFLADNSQEDNLPTDYFMDEVWRSRTADLTVIMEDTASLMTNAEAQAADLSAEIQNAGISITRLSGLFQASRGHPTEQLTLVQQMHVLHDKLTQRAQPLEQIAALIDGRLDETTALRKDIESLSAELGEQPVAGQLGEQPVAAELAEQPDRSAGSGNIAQENIVNQSELDIYRTTLLEAGEQLVAARSRLQAMLAPARSTLERIKRTVGGAESSLADIWQKYYLTPSDTNLDALLSTPALLAEWVETLDSRLSFAYPHTASDWFGVLKSFAFTAIIFTLLGFLALRGARMLPPRWRQACGQAVRQAGVLAGAGMAVLMASVNQNGGFYFGFIPPGSLILIAGVAAISWRLRAAVLPELEKHGSPLGRLYPPAAIGIFMLFSDLPARVLGITWALIILVFLVLIFKRNKRGSHEKLPLPERFSYGCALYFGLASLLVVFLGYARLSILLFMALFALVNLLILGNALMALARILMERLFPECEKPLRCAIAQALGIPLAWLLALLCALPWIWAAPGAYYLIRNLGSASYSIGEASFDFSRLLLIALLFFIFRSLISLGRASLASLPDKLPHLERGVIPPLRTMFTYLAWTIFLMTALGLLGVNFTSLAVVAGGLSVGVGLGMQNIVNNLVSGLMLIFGRTILVGDWIEVNGVAGTVQEISIRSTVVETAERTLVYVPNSTLMSGQFTNWTRGNRYVRQSIVVGVAYGSNTGQVAKLMLECANGHQHVLKTPAAAVFFDNFAESALNFKLNVFIDDFDNAPATLSELRFKINEVFKANGIGIPFPQMDVHLG